MSAINLLAVGRDFIALVGAIALDDGRQQAQQIVGALALFLGLRLVRQVALQRAPQAQCPQAFGNCLAFHQHPANIGVDEQRIGFLVGLRSAGQRTALPSVLGILHSVLVRDFALGQPLQANAEPRRVHHDEHRGETLHFLTDKETGRAVIIHHAGRIGMDAHFVFDRPTGHAVARTE